MITYMLIIQRSWCLPPPVASGYVQHRSVMSEKANGTQCARWFHLGVTQSREWTCPGGGGVEVGWGVWALRVLLLFKCVSSFSLIALFCSWHHPLCASSTGLKHKGNRRFFLLLLFQCASSWTMWCFCHHLLNCPGLFSVSYSNNGNCWLRNWLRIQKSASATSSDYTKVLRTKAVERDQIQPGGTKSYLE